jgi:hypothetical protein
VTLGLCLLLVWAAEPEQGSVVRLYDFSPRLEASIRGQDPGTFVAPSQPGSSTFEAPALQAPTVVPDAYNPFQPPAMMQDPFLTGPDPVLSAPYLMDPWYGGNPGLLPHQYGVSTRLDIGYLPQSDLEGLNANLDMFELDTEVRQNFPIGPNWALSSAPQFGYRAWTFAGAQAPFPRLNLFRFGWDLQLATPETYGWTWQFGFNPSINTDFEHNLTSDAWNFDTHVMAFYRIDRVWQIALGAGYWDRVDDVVIPYAGVIITPDDRWELRLLFPKSRISYYTGHAWGAAHWLYFTTEYRVEAYQFDQPFANPRNQIQYEDWRLALGVRSDHGWFDKYIEVGLVLGRNFEFRTGLPKTNVDDGMMVRAGIRF